MRIENGVSALLSLEENKFPGTATTEVEQPKTPSDDASVMVAEQSIRRASARLAAAQQAAKSAEISNFAQAQDIMRTLKTSLSTDANMTVRMHANLLADSVARLLN